jgi:phage baseplate assembly protein W
MVEPSYKDFDISLKRHPLTGDIITFSDDAAVRNALKNLVRLIRFDKPFSPGISSPLWDVMFEPITEGSAALIEVGLGFLIQDYEPRVNNVNITVIPLPDDNKYEVSVEFTIRKSQSRETLQLFLPVERLK